MAVSRMRSENMQYNPYYWRLSASFVVVCNAAGRVGGEAADTAQRASMVTSTPVWLGRHLVIYYRNSSVVVDLLWDRYHVPQNVFLVFKYRPYCIL